MSCHLKSDRVSFLGSRHVEHFLHRSSHVLLYCYCCCYYHHYTGGHAGALKIGNRRFTTVTPSHIVKHGSNDKPLLISSTHIIYLAFINVFSIIGNITVNIFIWKRDKICFTAVIDKTKKKRSVKLVFPTARIF